MYDRIIAILNANTNLETCFLLTKQYRKTHPHFGDFQFILSMLHQIQDSQGKPRTQIQESDLIKVDAVEGNFSEWKNFFFIYYSSKSKIVTNYHISKYI